MRKIVFCNIPMKPAVSIKRDVYTSEDLSIPVAETPVKYPVNAFLEKTLSGEDAVKAVLLVKKDSEGNYKQNISDCIAEMLAAAEKSGARIDYKIIESAFEETQEIHDNLLLNIVDEFEEGAHIISDITFGPKDLPIVLFTAMNFAEKFYNCEIDDIIYGQADFANDGSIKCMRICDMAPLYYLNAVTNTVNCSVPEDAKKMLKSLLSM